jgi:hypothetical protein
MADLSLASKIAHWAMVGVLDLGLLVLWGWQLQVFRGRRMKSPDESFDDWHDQPLCYGIALADMTISVPAALLATVLMIRDAAVGFFLYGAVAFWSLWVNLVTTAVSLRFHRPRPTFFWIFAYPFQVALALAYLVWLLVHFRVLSR